MKLPRGPEWLEAAIKIPRHAVPWHRRGFVAALPLSTETVFISDVVPPAVNGRRVAGMSFGGSAANVNYTYRFYRNGTWYDETLGNLTMASGPFCQVVPIFAVYAPTDLLELRVFQSTGGARDVSVYVWGWDF